MTCAYLAFTSKGLALARKLAAAQPGAVARCGENGVTLANWTAAQFAQSDALVFVGAVGIAVRAIAPHCRSKATDPAVVVLDECGRFAIPLLSGHLGGANDLARRLAKACGAVPVITTATDANGVFAVDEWAKHQHCLVAEPARIKKVSSALLAGRTVRFASDWPIQGTPPAGVEPAGDAAQASFALTITPTMTSNALHIIPRIAVLGIGCVSSFCGAAAALNAEYTLPGVSQTVIITRMEGRTPVPEGERLASLAVHGATMVIFLSIGLVDKVQAALLQGAYTEATPAAVVYKATWPEQKTVHCTVGTLAASTRAAGITKIALIVVGDFLAARYDRSKLYDPTFTTEYRKGAPQ